MRVEEIQMFVRVQRLAWRAMSARTRLDSTRETWRSRDEEKFRDSVRTRVILVDLGLEHDVVK